MNATATLFGTLDQASGYPTLVQTEILCLLVRRLDENPSVYVHKWID